MALDFPSSPTNGQIYSNYYYDSTTGAWRANAPLAVGVPLGGDTNYVLTKNTATDYDTSWRPGPALVPVIPTAVSVDAGSGSINSTTGLISFTGNTTLTVTNAFSSTYAYYRIIIEVVSTSAAADARFQMRTSAGSTTATGYVGGRFGVSDAGAFNGGNSTTFFLIGRTSGNTTGYASTFDVLNPQATLRTRALGNSTESAYSYGFAGTLNDNTSYTDFVFSMASSTMTTGKLEIYGYN